jgi:hypothetical protein
VTVARVGARRCLLALGQEAPAIQELGLARSDAEAMGAERLIDEIDELEQGAEGVTLRSS